jgi:ribosomal protein S18 acetylase RimI-like enzyme
MVIENHITANVVLDIPLMHHGTKGMHWGVRKNYQEIRNAPVSHLDLTSTKGHKVSIDELRKPIIGAAIASVFPRFRNSLDNSKAFSISANGNHVGEAQFYAKSKDELNLVWLGVKKSQRGKGYASAVFEAAIHYGKEKGYSKLTLEVPGNAPDAKHIYAKQGFKVSGPTVGNAKTDPMWGGLTPMSYNIKDPSKVAPHLVHADQNDAELEQALLSTFPDFVIDSSPVAHEDVILGGVLIHHGIKGMHWGVRRDRSSKVTVTHTPGKRIKTTGGHERPAHIDAKVAARSKQVAKSSTTDALSNKELKALVERMNLEQQYSRLSASPKGEGRKFVENQIKQVGQQHVAKLIAKHAAKLGAAALV